MGLGRVLRDVETSRRARSSVHRGCTTKRPAELRRHGEADRVREGEGLTARLSVAVVRLEAQAIDGDAGAEQTRVSRRCSVGLVVLVLLLLAGGYWTLQGSLLDLPRHLARHAAGWFE